MKTKAVKRGKTKAPARDDGTLEPRRVRHSSNGRLD